MKSRICLVVRWSDGEAAGELVRVIGSPHAPAVDAIAVALAGADHTVPAADDTAVHLLDARFVLVPTAGFGPEDPAALLAVDDTWTLADLAQVVGRSDGLRLEPASSHGDDDAYVLTLEDFRGFGEFAVNVAGAVTLMRGVARTVHRFRTRQLRQLASGDAPIVAGG